MIMMMIMVMVMAMVMTMMIMIVIVIVIVIVTKNILWFTMKNRSLSSICQNDLQAVTITEKNELVCSYTR